MVQRGRARGAEAAPGLEAPRERAPQEDACPPVSPARSYHHCHGRLDPRCSAQRARLHGLRWVQFFYGCVDQFVRGYFACDPDFLHPVAGVGSRAGGREDGPDQDGSPPQAALELPQRRHGSGAGRGRDGEAGDGAQRRALGHVAEHPLDAQLVCDPGEEDGQLQRGGVAPCIPHLPLCRPIQGDSHWYPGEGSEANQRAPHGPERQLAARLRVLQQGRLRGA
mmetsp:Transcript_77384/g.206590  ORF Transcript_77384/g.206590 Transcript_77384/m.206590 type:complete len:223 (+) Transcript_77384:2073-2741(+)